MVQTVFSGVVFHPRVLTVLDRLGTPPSVVAGVVRQPHATYPARDGRCQVFLGETMAAIVDPDSGEVIAVTSAATAREQRRLPRHGALPRAKGGGCGNRFPTTVADLLARATRAGLRVEPTGGDHVRVTRPGGQVSVTLPGTPSDHRSIPNSVLTIRRVLGVDLRTGG